MTLKSELKSILVVFLLLQALNVLASEVCQLANGKSGVCVALGDCKRDQDGILFASDFCSNNFSQICCESEKLKVSGVQAMSLNYETFESFRLFDLSNCGKLQESHRIAGGQEADLMEFPWIALIGYLNLDSIEFNCGGSLISEHYVLSAAHCFHNSTRNQRLNPKLVRLGEHNKATARDCKKESDGKTRCADPVQDIEIDRGSIVVHPQFDRHKNSHDIALIRLSEAAKVHQNNIKPICLPFSRDFNALPSSMVVIGFGRTESSESNSDVLLKANVKTITNEECDSLYFNQLDLIDTQFCAGDVSDSCKGDSGSPTQFPQRINSALHPQYIQYGIVSFGDNECGSPLPGIYVKVHPFLPWILENVK